MADIVWSSYIAPLIAVFAGALIAPYIDYKRSKKESTYALKCFQSEIDDFSDEAKKYVTSFFDGYIKSKKASIGIIKNDENLYPLTFYPKIEFLTIETLIKTSFLQLTKDQRKAVKSLSVIVNNINENTIILSQLRTIDDFKKSQSNFMSATNSSASFYYLVTKMAKENNKFAYTDESSDEICKRTMKELGLSFEQSVFNTAHNELG